MLIDKNTYNDITFTLKDYFRAPIFTASKIKQTRVVRVGEDIWTIGIKNPKNEDAPIICNSLTIEHALIIFGVFAFTNIQERSQKIHFSFNQLCHLIYGCSNPSTYKKANKLLYDIENCWCSIKYPDGNIRHFRVLKNADTVQKPLRTKSKKLSPELWLDSVELHEEFLKLIYRIENRLCLRISLIRQLSSSLARTIYLYLPSRAINASKNGNVFRITLTKLLEQVGYDIPKNKSQRYQLFTQNKRSILSQLNGAKLLSDKTFRCRLEETSDNKDYNLVCWVEFPKGVSANEPTNSPLYDAFKSAGGTLKLWKERLSTIKSCEFDMYELEALGYIPDWKTSEPFFLMAKCLMGGLFTECLGIVKNHILESKEISKSPLHMLNNEIMEAMKKMKV